PGELQRYSPRDLGRANLDVPGVLQQPGQGAGGFAAAEVPDRDRQLFHGRLSVGVWDKRRTIDAHRAVLVSEPATRGRCGATTPRWGCGRGRRPAPTHPDM